MAKYYEEFSRLSIDKMSQRITDMTYLYKNTEVPKGHYKKLLDEQVEMAMEQIIETGLLDVYVKSIKNLKESSPKLFLQAMVCVSKKINPMNMRPNEQFALELLWGMLAGDNKEILNEEIIKGFVDLLNTPIGSDMEDSSM